MLSGIACIREGDDKWQVILDDSFTYVNHKIRMRDQVDLPGLAEERHAMRWAQRQPSWARGHSPYGMLKWDVQGAPTLVRKVKHAWRYLCFRLRQQWYVSTNGMFGESSAAMWWAHLYAYIHRLIHHTGNHISWGFVFFHRLFFSSVACVIWSYL